MLVHRSRKSASPEQKADISIYIVQHKQDDKQGNLPANRKIRPSFALHWAQPDWLCFHFVNPYNENRIEVQLSIISRFLVCLILNMGLCHSQSAREI